MNMQSNVSYEDEVPVRVVNKQHNTPQNRAEDVERERLYAALAHAIGPITIALMLIFDGGLYWLGMLFFTVLIYSSYREKSALVRFHARQALAAQLLGTVGWLIAVTLGAAAWVILLMISLVLILLLVGLILTPVVAIVGPLAFLASFALPLGVAVFGAIGAWETWNGKDFRYPILADWLDNRLGKIQNEAKQSVPVV
ncbi:MAG: hypothetical protein ACLFTK_13190 [Anaerolineales bacterium]